jgi:S-adenosylmethionine:tRNA ribosyltransferase-isomerase
MPEHDPLAAESYAYDLPEELIAQEPLADRAAARLLVVSRADGSLAHRSIRDLPDLLRPGDLVVVNDTKVVPARLVGRRAKTGGRWEGLFLRREADGPHAGAWVVLAQTRGRRADRAHGPRRHRKRVARPRRPGRRWRVAGEAGGPVAG